MSTPTARSPATRTCGARKYDPCRDLRFFEMSGGARVFVDQAAQDGFSEDPSAVEVGNYEVATVVFTVGDSLGDPLVPVLLWGSGRCRAC
jgi:hypothetical protein